MCFLHCIVLTYFFVLMATKKPIGKEQQEVWRVECELGLISDPECPIDGGWTPWGPWGACNGPCDEMGHRRRFRECNNPYPSEDGLPCTGPDHQIESCYLTNCTVADFKKLVEGDDIRKEALLELEAVPILMRRCLQMECPFEEIETILASDNTWQISAESLWNSLQCVKHNLGCPLIGKWGSWSDWTPCGARCGYGIRWRFRKCDTPPPSNEHLYCMGAPVQVDECQGDQCAISKRDSGGKWGEWGEWSSCSESCGMGVRRRKRTCHETNTPRLLFSSWGTHCRGPHDQIEVCDNKECKLNGGWSGWGPWGPCSHTCGSGKRSRIRTCTRPEPAGSGQNCSGSKTEIGYCFLTPCKTFSHTVAVFNGESFLKYAFDNKRSTLFHFYARFLPLSPHGIIVRRGNAHSPLVRLSLQKWHLCLDAVGTSRTCTAPRLCTRAEIDPAVWHSVLITVTSLAITMRIDNDPVTIKSTFSCNPELPNAKMNIVVGERFHGEIQEIILNFIPLCMVVNRKRDGKFAYCPTIGSDITYEKAGTEEAFIILDNEEYLRLPCFENQEDWQINITLKSKIPTGTIIFLQDNTAQSWLHVHLQNMRLKLKFSLAGYRSESLSSSDCPPNQWLDIVISKKRGINTIETSIINTGERLHVMFQEQFPRLRLLYDNSSTMTAPDSTHEFCTDEYFVGGVPATVKDNVVMEDFSSLTVIIATITVNNVLLDLHDYSVERYKDNNIQVSLRTASVSGSYYETAWGKSNRLNLTCLHARSIRSPNTAYWLYLDTAVYGHRRDNSLRSLDDGKVLRLVATANNDLRGFYSCRAHSVRRSRNIVTYGVLGQINHTLTGPDLTTAIAVVTTLTLVIGTLVCLFIEGFHDIRNGYGFYRDAHLSPEEEAEAVCNYIDQNMHLIGDTVTAEIAKAKARRIGRQLACQSIGSTCTHEEMMQKETIIPTNEESLSEPGGLPALPEVKNSGIEAMHDVFKCDQSYVSSPRHGSISSPRTKLTSSSDATSPRVICSRLLLGKRMTFTKDSYKKKKQSRILRKSRSKLFTIKSSSYLNQSPAQKILARFRALKSEDC